MGQYWARDAIGNLNYGENLKVLQIPSIGSAWNASQQTTLTIVPENPYESEREIIISRSDEFVPNDGEIEYGLWNGSYDPSYVGFASCELYFKVAGNLDNYPTLQSFSDDVRMLFQNPIVGGSEDFFMKKVLSTKPQASEQ